ncbi:Clp protease N-terminal domain-containing protein [Streptomyces sp. NBC_00286]|uniref:Clp protease N-terminal domain-containing protein n=1 Tax=Streptomyces sp. NBC_00286 TaxID=2975701 RepID=UPI002E2DC3A9|nr:Clp protease N-terminal domain-containing protein [Streptomyces sp. NBC_00286]
MEATKTPDWNVVGILGAARGAKGDAEGAIGTEHLLAGITTAKGPAREALADEGATKTALLTVLRNRMHKEGAWSADDDAEGSVASQDILGEDGDRRTHFTGAAARALTAAMEHAQREDAKKFGAEYLLRGLLEEDNRAVELLGACGISPHAVRTRLDGGSGSQEDDLNPLLHPTRDVLLGRSHYRRMPSLWMRWLVRLSGVNWASLPAGWVRQETYEQARRLGHRVVGTEHVLLAILATHEVALRYPHLSAGSAPDQETQYEGGERLARLGIDYASVHRALTAGDRIHLTADARPVEQYVDEAAGLNLTSTADPGTGPLVEALLSEETRARQLIDALTSTSGN